LDDDSRSGGADAGAVDPWVAATEVELGEAAVWLAGSVGTAGPGLVALCAQALDAPIKRAEARTIGDAVAQAIVNKRMFLPRFEQIKPLGILMP
jgi:hypothetical protein